MTKVLLWRDVDGSFVGGGLWDLFIFSPQFYLESKLLRKKKKQKNTFVNLKKTNLVGLSYLTCLILGS